MLPEDRPEWAGPGNDRDRRTCDQAACAAASETGFGSASDWSTANVACSAFAAAVLTNWLAAFSTFRVAARTFLAVLRMAERAWRFATRTVLRVARAAFRAVLRALRTTLRDLRRALTRAPAFFTAVFLRTTLTFLRTVRRLLCAGRRRAVFLAFLLAAMGLLQMMLTPRGVTGSDARPSS